MGKYGPATDQSDCRYGSGHIIKMCCNTSNWHAVHTFIVAFPPKPFIKHCYSEIIGDSHAYKLDVISVGTKVLSF